MNPAEALDELMQALDRERDALVASDAEALIAAGTAKLAALDRVSEHFRTASAPGDWEPQLRRAFERHQSNAELLQRRRHEATWLLKMLGAVDPAAAYGPAGERKDAAITRRIAEA